MKFISTKVHGILDYSSAVLLIISPWLFGFATGGAAQWVPIIVGILIIGLSLFTSYELGAIRKIPMRSHLALDIVTGILLALSPWIFGFADIVFWPHLIFGLLESGAGMFTSMVPKKGADVLAR